MELWAESWWLLKLKALCCRLQVKVVVGCGHSWTQSVCRLHYYTIVCNIGAAVALVTVELEAAVEELSNFPLCSSTRDCRRCDWKTSDCLKMNEHHNHHRLAINNSLDKWDQQPIKPFFASFFSSTLTRTDGYSFPNNPPLLKMIGLVIFRSFLCQLTNRPHSPSKLQKCVSCNKIQKKKRHKDFFQKEKKRLSYLQRQDRKTGTGWTKEWQKALY